jgi:hypothetical protein
MDQTQEAFEDALGWCADAHKTLGEKIQAPIGADMTIFVVDPLEALGPEPAKAAVPPPRQPDAKGKDLERSEAAAPPPLPLEDKGKQHEVSDGESSSEFDFDIDDYM